MKNFLLVLLLGTPFLIFGQLQIGQDIDGEALFDNTGTSVSLSADGSVVAIGALGNDDNGNLSGHVRIYSNESGTWTQIGSDIDGEAAGDRSGSSVSLSADGSVVAIGAPENDGNGSNSGHVRIYENQSGSWIQIGNDIDSEAQFDFSGWSVSLSADGSMVAIGANFNDGTALDSGHVRIYGNQSGSWIQIGSDIDGEAYYDASGWSVSLSGDGSIVAIGARWNNGNGSDSGHVRIYRNQSGNWTQIGSDIDGEAQGDESGSSVSLSADGSVVAMGAPYNNGNGTWSGHTRVYKNQSGSWTQIGSDIDSEAQGDHSGYSVNLSGDGSVVAIGAPYNDDNGGDSGHVRIYRNEAGTWNQLGSDINGEAMGDRSGSSVSLSVDGSIVAIGAPGDGQGGELGYVRAYDLSALLSLDENVLSNFNIFPNPAKTQFTIKLNQSLVLEKATIYNSLGQLITSVQEIMVDTSELSTGLYYVEVVTNKGKATKKLVIE